MDPTNEQSSEHVYRATAVIRNNAGIHCRPSAVIVKEARGFNAEIVVRSSRGDTANPSSAIELLALGLDQGSEIEIQAKGPDAEPCCRRLAELFETQYDFPPREDGRKDECTGAAPA